MQQCVHDVKSWMTHNKLKLHDEKTEALIVSEPRISNSIPLPDSLTVGTSTVRFSQSAKCLGVTLDTHFTMIALVVDLIRTANFELRRINSIRHYLFVQATETLVSAFDLPRLDYCNFLLSGCPQHLLNRLQKVQNNAARLILKAPKTDHITPHLRTLHWLQSMLESNANFVLFVLVLSLLLVLSIFLIYSRFSHPLGNSDLLQTSVHCAFHLSILSHMMYALSLTPLQHSGTHFQKTSDLLSQFLPLDQH